MVMPRAFLDPRSLHVSASHKVYNSSHKGLLEACHKVYNSDGIVMTRCSNRHDRHDAPLQRRAAARARSKCGGSAWPGGRALRLQRHAAPTRTAHAAVARKRCPARSCMMMSETPSPPSPSAGARSAPCTKRLDRRKAHDVFDLPTTNPSKTMCNKTSSE